MYHINIFRLYFQVFTLADITSADGLNILSSTADGEKDDIRISTFNDQYSLAPQIILGLYSVNFFSVCLQIDGYIRDWGASTYLLLQTGFADLVTPAPITRRTRSNRTWYQIAPHPMHGPPEDPIFPVTIIIIHIIQTDLLLSPALLHSPPQPPPRIPLSGIQPQSQDYSTSR